MHGTIHGSIYGTRYTEHGGQLGRITDRTGAVHAELVWRPSGVDAAPGRLDAGDSANRAATAAALDRLVVTGATVDGTVIEHPLLGAAHTVGDTAMTAIDWARPSEIPAIAEPGRLPLGAGSALLNTIAVLAQRAGVTALRYAGPYPTRALWHALARSFRAVVPGPVGASPAGSGPAGSAVDHAHAALEAVFTADAMARALRVARDPIAIDFIPAPHERLAIAGGFVELRAGVERAVIGGIAYTPDGSPARLAPADATTDSDAARMVASAHCEIWFGDAPYARVAALAADGTLLDGPHPIPACTSPVIGRAFPVALRVAIAELVAEAVAAPLADTARALCGDQPLAWADLGARAARETADGFAVHAALWDRIAPLGLGRLALALAEALAPVVTAAAVRRASVAAPG